MREAIRDIERLHHILEQIDALMELVPTLSFETFDHFQVSKAGLWDTLTNDLPELRPFIVKYIEELSSD